MRLAYRIATMKPMFQGPESLIPTVSSIVLSHRADIKDRVLISANNVAQYYWDTGRDDWDIYRDCPNWTPPSNGFFMEWKTPPEYTEEFSERFKDVEVVYSESGLVFDVHDTNKLPDEDRSILFDRLRPSAIHIHGDKADEMLSLGRWAMMVHFWVSSPQRPVCSSPTATALKVGYLVGGDGKLIAMGMGNTQRDSDKTFLLSAMTIAGLTLSFMNCKNIRTTETADPRKPSWHAQERFPVLKFKTIDIGQPTVRRQGIPGDPTGRKMSLQFVRGHTATYTAERPLFGKHVGTYYIPYHARGNSSLGTTITDYDVKPPE